jgi:hypothetical protein
MFSKQILYKPKYKATCYFSNKEIRKNVLGVWGPKLNISFSSGGCKEIEVHRIYS